MRPHQSLLASVVVAFGVILTPSVAPAQQASAEGAELANTERTRAVVLAFIEAINRGDASALRDLLAEDAEWTMPGNLPISGTYRGRDAIFTDFLARNMQGLEPGSVRIEVRSLVAEGSIASVEWLHTSRTAAGQPYRNDYSNVFEVRDGRIVRVREYVDTQRVQETFFPEITDGDP